jgi:hypothetical protein
MKMTGRSCAALLIWVALAGCDLGEGLPSAPTPADRFHRDLHARSENIRRENREKRRRDWEALQWNMQREAEARRAEDRDDDDRSKMWQLVENE